MIRLEKACPRSGTRLQSEADTSSRPVRKSEARPIAAQPRLELLRHHLTAIALQLQLGPTGQAATCPASSTLDREIENSNPGAAPYCGTLSANDYAVAVMLDFVDPVGPGPVLRLG
jgi:hypothetical protein